ncbi:MAG: GNAT family N-acetyltransferase [Pseudomonadota bacterium]
MEFGIRLCDASDRDWVVTQHAEHYARVDGFDDSFGPLVAHIVDGFLDDHDSASEAGWIAQDSGQRLGSIFCVRLDEHTAKLRLFYVVETARGTGVAQGLLTQCMTFARDAGYRDMTLWTHESHAAAGRIYQRNGFAQTQAKPVHSFGLDLVEETWEITL